MSAKKIFFTTIFTVLLAFIAKSTTWTTISNGFWNDPATWSTGIVPPLSSADSFNIKFPVAIQNNLTFNTGALLNIDSTGGICGHYKVTVKSGARISKFGILELDTLSIPGGIVTCQGPGQVILTCYGVISNGGSFSVNGCSLAVGPWFNCLQPAYAFVLGINEKDTNNPVVVYPNPNNGSFTLTYHLSAVKAELKIINLLGENVYRQYLYGTEGSVEITISELRQGFYFWEIVSEEGITKKGKIEVLK